MFFSILKQITREITIELQKEKIYLKEWIEFHKERIKEIRTGERSSRI